MRKHILKRRSGFTLVEILMVVIILGIAGAIVVPQMSSRDDLRAGAACRVMMADLIYAQNMAITKAKNHYVVFNIDAQQYKVLAPDMSLLTHPVTLDPYLIQMGSAGKSGMRDSNLVSAAFTGGAASSSTIAFDEMGAPKVYASGTSQAMTSGSVVIQSGTYKLRIDVEPFTGQIKVTPTN